MSTVAPRASNVVMNERRCITHFVLARFINRPVVVPSDRKWTVASFYLHFVQKIWNTGDSRYWKGREDLGLCAVNQRVPSNRCFFYMQRREIDRNTKGLIILSREERAQKHGVSVTCTCTREGSKRAVATVERLSVFVQFTQKHPLTKVHHKTSTAKQCKSFHFNVNYTRFARYWRSKLYFFFWTRRNSKDCRDVVGQETGRFEMLANAIPTTIVPLMSVIYIEFDSISRLVQIGTCLPGSCLSLLNCDRSKNGLVSDRIVVCLAFVLPTWAEVAWTIRRSKIDLYWKGESVLCVVVATVVGPIWFVMKLGSINFCTALICNKNTTFLTLWYIPTIDMVGDKLHESPF